jgi:ATP-dependent helicase/nuclease subunit A
MVTRDARGAVRSVTVSDFKTDRIISEMEMNDAVGRHSSQLNLYRRVAAVLTGVPATTVEAEVVFTALRQRVPVLA